MPKPTLLIDADGVAFKVCAGCQVDILWDGDLVTRQLDLSQAKDTFDGILQKYRVAADADGFPNAQIILAWSCPTRKYFRHVISPTYKANRKGASPVGFKFFREWAEHAYPSKTKPGLEADDILGIYATHPKLIPGVKIIVSHDKDLQQIPGLHMAAADPLKGLFKVTKPTAERMLWMQVLTGDAVDGYTGIPKMGPVKAAKALEKVSFGGCYEEAVRRAYEKAGLSEEDMALQINMARILTANTYDFRNKEPILWQPSTQL